MEAFDWRFLPSELLAQDDELMGDLLSLLARKQYLEKSLKSDVQAYYEGYKKTIGANVKVPGPTAQATRH